MKSFLIDSNLLFQWSERISRDSSVALDAMSIRNAELVSIWDAELGLLDSTTPITQRFKFFEFLIVPLSDLMQAYAKLYTKYFDSAYLEVFAKILAFALNALSAARLIESEMRTFLLERDRSLDPELERSMTVVRNGFESTKMTANSLIQSRDVPLSEEVRDLISFALTRANGISARSKS